MSKLLNKDYTIDLPHNLIIFPLNNSMRNSVYNSIRSLINDLLYDSIILSNI